MDAVMLLSWKCTRARIDMTAAACESAEKFGTRQGPTTLPTLDKARAAKIQEQETLLRAAVNVGDDYHLNCQYSCFVRSSCSSFLAGAFKFCTLLYTKNITCCLPTARRVSIEKFPLSALVLFEMQPTLLIFPCMKTIYIDFPMKVEIYRIEYTPLTPAMVLDSNISRATSSIHRARY
ncbi:hypothetical protein NC651_019270 [Populus alba x Populus x berolinensis]|nr:hypothetical protein NC651_019270 [Populus alba x Populus x berolinensis]